MKLSDLREERVGLLTCQGSLKVFARVEFEMAGTLPASVSWANYDLLLFKEQFKTLYETKNLCDILVRVVRTKRNSSSSSSSSSSSPPPLGNHSHGVSSLPSHPHHHHNCVASHSAYTDHSSSSTSSSSPVMINRSCSGGGAGGANIFNMSSNGRVYDNNSTITSPKCKRVCF